jgi:hypothetical protein
VLLIAIGLIAGGALFVALASKRLRGRKVIVGSLALLVIATACMGSEETPPDRVKGESITRGDGNGGGNNDGEDDNGAPGEDDSLDDPAVEPGDGPDGEDDVPFGDDEPDGDLGDVADPIDDGIDDDAVAAPPPTEPETRVVRRVRTRTIDEEDLAIQASPSLNGDTRTISSGGGGHPTTRAGAALLSSDVVAQGKRLVASVSVSNTSERKRLHVTGDLLYKVAGFGTLNAGQIDELLNPGGEVTAQFEFRVPGGTFSAQPSFSAS